MTVPKVFFWLWHTCCGMCTWGGDHLLGQSQSNILLSVIAMTRVSSSSVPQVPFPTRWPKEDKLSAEILSLYLYRTLTYHLQSYRFSPSTNKKGSGVGSFAYVERCIRESDAELQDPESFIVMRTKHSALFSRGIYWVYFWCSSLWPHPWKDSSAQKLPVFS